MAKVPGRIIREIYPHAYLLYASKDSLEKGRKLEKGAVICFLASMLFAAFAIEAYLNHVGKQKFSTWQEIERSLGPKEKLLLLCEVGNYHIDFSRRPFQTFTEIVKFRDLVVHAKPEVISADEIEVDENGEITAVPESKWLEKCTAKKATRFYEDSESLMRELHANLRIEGFDVSITEHLHWKIRESDMKR